MTTRELTVRDIAERIEQLPVDQRDLAHCYLHALGFVLVPGSASLPTPTLRRVMGGGSAMPNYLACADFELADDEFEDADDRGTIVSVARTQNVQTGDRRKPIIMHDRDLRATAGDAGKSAGKVKRHG